MAADPSQIPFQILNPIPYYTGQNPDPGVFSNLTDLGPQFYWVRSEKGWKQLGYKEPAPPNPNMSPEEKLVRELDFSRHDVLLFLRGAMGTTGYSIQLTQVLSDGNTLQFHLDAPSPNPNSARGAAITYPRQMVRVEKLSRDASIVFFHNGEAVTYTIHILE